MTALQSAVVLVLDGQSRILVVDNRAHGGVGVPGGKVEPDGETVVQAAIRELREEVDLVAMEGDLRLLFAAEREPPSPWGPRRGDEHEDG